MLMYFYRYCIVLLLSFSLSGCLKQPPAPIEYGSSPAKAKSEDYYDASSEIVEVKPKSTTFWGEKEVIEEKPEAQEEEKPLSLVSNKNGKEIYHEVIEGETLDSIAKQYGVSKETLIKKNDLEPPYELEELQLIMIPPKGSIPEVKKKQVETKLPDKTTPPAATPVVSGAGKLPVEGSIVSKFGQSYLGAINQGINISAPMGTDVYSSSNGEVIHSAYDPKFGNLIIIKSHNEDIFMAYAHMSDLSLKVGERVVEGQVLGHVGQTGKVTKPQLHFAIRKGKIPMDPVGYLKR